MKPAARTLDIVLQSAEGLKKVNNSRMSAYAVAWIEPGLRVPSPLDKRHGRNPEWNATISITLDDRAMSQAGQRLHIELLGQGLVSTRPIGFVTVDMTDILLLGAEGDAVRAPFFEHPVRRRSGRQQGVLNFELCLQASTSTRASAKQGKVLRWADEDTSSALPREPRYQRESMFPASSANKASALPLSQYYPHEPVSPRMERKSSRNSSRRGDRGFVFALPMGRSNSRRQDSELDEISLLQSSY